ncbi:hypothetical protein ACS0TY_022612 [Phlomoides rotata]
MCKKIKKKIRKKKGNKALFSGSPNLKPANSLKYSRENKTAHSRLTAAPLKQNLTTVAVGRSAIVHFRATTIVFRRQESRTTPLAGVLPLTGSLCPSTRNLQQKLIPEQLIFG